MSTQHVLRVAREDGGQAVLLNVQDPAKEGESLVIEGTEGETPYIGRFSSKAIASSRASNSPVPASMWPSVISYFLQHGPLPSLSSPPPTLSLSATLVPSSALTLHFKQTVAAGISQRLGTLTLKAEPQYDMDTLPWTEAAISRAESLSKELEEAQERAHQSEDRAKKLASQLEELVNAKKKSEDQMLAAFVDVLNAKKRKVRELQRLVEALNGNGGLKYDRSKSGTGGSVKPESMSQIDAGARRKAGASRHGKRKADQAIENQNTSLQQMDWEPMARPNASEDDGSFEQMHSPAADRDEDSTESEGGANEVSIQRRSIGKLDGSKRGKETASGAKDDGTAGAESSQIAKETEASPPRRDLPFTRQAEAAAERENGGEETSDDDDEL